MRQCLDVNTTLAGERVQLFAEGEHLIVVPRILCTQNLRESVEDNKFNLWHLGKEVCQNLYRLLDLSGEFVDEMNPGVLRWLVI